MGSFLQPGYSLLFAWVLAEQAGLPMPAVPMLLGMGAMAANGRIHFAVATAVALVASLVADLAWYEIGRHRGISLIRSLCRISLEKDSCARRTERLYGKYGAFALVIAKFVPGLNFAAAPLSGVFQMKRWRFLLFNAAGVTAWVLVYMGLGFVFSRQLNRVAHAANSAGHSLLALLVALALSAFAVWKYRRRRWFLSEMRCSRISASELKELIEQGSPLTIIDVRHPLDVLSHPFTIPGAIRIPLEQINAHSLEHRGESQIVIYCTCPNEASSSRALHLLQQRGIRQVKVLAGGLQGWQDKGFDVHKFAFAAQDIQAFRPIWAF